MFSLNVWSRFNLKENKVKPLAPKSCKVTLSDLQYEQVPPWIDGGRCSRILVHVRLLSDQSSVQWPVDHLVCIMFLIMTMPTSSINSLQVLPLAIKVEFSGAPNIFNHHHANCIYKFTSGFIIGHQCCVQWNTCSKEGHAKCSIIDSTCRIDPQHLKTAFLYESDW